MTDWRAEYAATAETIRAAAATAAPMLTGFSSCVDHVYRLETETLDALAAARSGRHVHPAIAALAQQGLDRIGSGHGGEIFVPAVESEPELRALLGEPVAHQLGGTGAQASWSVATLGAPSVLALADRSREQLDVLLPSIGLCADGATTTVAQVAPDGPPAKPPHYILEFGAGTRWSGGTVPRSSRIIVRLADDGIERDAEFAALAPTLAARAGAGLVSGLNGVPASDLESREWVRCVVGEWRAAGLAAIHLELAEYVRPGALVEIAAEYIGLADSLGLSLSELTVFGGAGNDPARLAHDIAMRFGLRRVVVHADTWSMSVHRGDAEPEAAALTLGNLLAATRARHGAPTADLHLDDAAQFADDRPPSGQLEPGWRVECVPSPYLARPAATIGLGDTFVAGLLLASCLRL